MFCGCDNQTKRNTEKITALSEKLVRLQQNQATQLATLQAQLDALAPRLDQMTSQHFEKSHDDAFFFHTNTLYLLLTVGRKIDAELQVAESQRQAEHDLAYSYHTNELRTMYLAIAQIEDDLASQENRLTNHINAETRRINSAIGGELLEQIKQSVPNEAELNRRQQIAADVAQLRRDLALIKLRQGITNSLP